jgi:hypothetical protein
MHRLAVTAVSLGLIALIPSSLRGQPRTTDPTHNTTTSDAPGLDASTSKCDISDDAAYGVSREKPILVGGGTANGPSREVRYLSALRGAAGEGLHFRRQGSGFGPDQTILDAYDVQEGDKHLTLYMDEYRWAAPRAPAGLTCAAPFGLARPAPDPFEITNALHQIGIDMASQDVAPISLDEDGSGAHGVVFDYVRIVQRGARDAASRGDEVHARQMPRALATPRVVVVVKPFSCGGNEIAPDRVTMTNVVNGARQDVRLAPDQTMNAAIPGFDSPAGAIAVAFAETELPPSSEVRVHYAQSCAGAQELSFPLRASGPRPVTLTGPARLAQPGSPPDSTIVVQVFVGFDGTLQAPMYVSGPEERADEAIEAVRAWQFQPPRVNGAPLLIIQRIPVTFQP